MRVQILGLVALLAVVSWLTTPQEHQAGIHVPPPAPELAKNTYADPLEMVLGGVEPALASRAVEK